ncbi:uncharacterized protein LOC110419631 [Herrania umbratica]|uniref:Uncharacterized protein LOC110419631 n=1 Tax=Herrania umbratica TaxID=108875 RepID=A0A6J1APF3_9ROSI|nr:uncharacterized protein LOC110419631 [Herrania umbratica]
MERSRLNMRGRCSGSTPSEESALDFERNCCCHPHLPSFSPPTLQPFASAGMHNESNAPYFSWPPSSRLNDAAEERANYFANLQKGVLPETLGRLPKGQQATTLLELMTIRAFHSKILRCYSLGTAIGFRIKKGVLTETPAILVFVSRKVDKQWLSPIQCLPTALEGPGGVWCDVDVVEFSYFGAPEPTPKEQLYTEIVDDLRGGDPHIGSGSQVLSSCLVIFFHSPAETFVRADGAFIPFTDDFDMSTVTTSVKGVGEIGDVKVIDLQSSIGSIIGKQVTKVGRSSGLTSGTVLAYALEYNDEKGICFLTDFLVVGENQQSFDLEGDSGSLIIMKGENGEKPRPIGIIWGGTANRGRLKLKVGQPPENWTSGVDLGRLLNLLELDIIITEEGLRVAVQEQRAASAAAIASTVGDSSPPDGVLLKDKSENKFEALAFQIQHIPLEVDCNSPEVNPSTIKSEFHLEDGINAGPSVEHQFIPSFIGRSPLHKNFSDKAVSENLASLRNGCDEDFCVSLHLGDNEAKRRRSEASTSTEEPK